MLNFLYSPSDVKFSQTQKLNNYENVDDFKVADNLNEAIITRYNNPKEDISLIAVYFKDEKYINFYTKSIKYITPWKLSLTITPSYPIYNLAIEFTHLNFKKYACVINQEIFIMQWDQNNWMLNFQESEETHLFLPAQINDKPKDIYLRNNVVNTLETKNGIIISTSGLDVEDTTGRIYNWRIWGLTKDLKLHVLYTQDTESTHQYLREENIFSYYDFDDKFHILQSTWNLDSKPRPTSTLQSIEIDENLILPATVVTLFDGLFSANQWVRFAIDAQGELIIALNRTSTPFGCLWYANSSILKSNRPLNFNPTNITGDFKPMPFSDELLNNIIFNDGYLNQNNNLFYLNITLVGKGSEVLALNNGAETTPIDVDVITTDMQPESLVPFSTYSILKRISSYDTNGSISFISFNLNYSGYIDDINNRPINFPINKKPVVNIMLISIIAAASIASVLTIGIFSYLVRKKKKIGK